MDYQFNLRQGAQRKFRMSPVFSTPSFDRHFSTKGNIDGCSCTTNKEAVKPMLSMFSDFNTSQDTLQKTNLLKKATKILPPITSFAGSSSMAVSYIVGGFVGTNSQASSSSQNICNLLDALVNSFHSRDEHGIKETIKESFPDTLHNSNSPTGFKTSTSTISQVPANPKRSYADVTKGIFPKPYVSLESGILPLNFTNIKCELNVCSNSMLTMYATNNCLIGNSSLLDMNKGSEHGNMSTVSENKYSAMPVANGLVDNCRDSTSSDNSSLSPEISIDSVLPVEDLNPCSNAQSNPLKFPVNCLLNYRNNRTISECSVDSEDSFVVFQNDEDAICDSGSDEECLSDDLDEVDNQKVFTCSGSSLSPVIKTKKVSFKPDENLVEIHTIVAWNYAHRAARIGPWETYARDRVRFESRIQQISKVLSPILEASHRAAVYQERFMGNK